MPEGNRGESGNRVVPPSGLEPEPLGLQPSAQTVYASGGLRAPRAGAARARGGYPPCSSCPRRARRRSSSSFFGCHRAMHGRTSGLRAAAFAADAPRASARPPVAWAHLSRFEIWIKDLESKCQIVLRSDERPETSKGRPVFPRRPFRTRRVLARYSCGGPPQVPVSARSGTKPEADRSRHAGFSVAAWAISAGLCAASFDTGSSERRNE